MNWRGPAVVVALLAIGAGSGFAASAASRDTAVGSGVPSPVRADGADMPVEAPRPYAQDPDDPALEPGIAMSQATMGSGKFELFFPAPTGWRINDNASSERKWKDPGTSDNTYVMRIGQIDSQGVSIPEAIDLRVARLLDEADDVVIIDRGASSLEYTYRGIANNLRHAFMVWLDLDSSGQADVEIVVHGRERDVAGAEDLIERVSEGMRGATGGPV
ncbi:hypothetical protein [Nocardioides hwasunensis]|uniref:DUF1795 domain-containing protein n=1 Tax=Nocardioides hwasunensis TaxID=397258 RepID=A0ABR8MP47_9ACTN|nr:hypothetical protein [Nocardioides hwasunensis]MBD3916612.1 hypothetical protein [Nocardioides hwasunensis]